MTHYDPIFPKTRLSTVTSYTLEVNQLDDVRQTFKLVTRAFSELPISRLAIDLGHLTTMYHAGLTHEIALQGGFVLDGGVFKLQQSFGEDDKVYFTIFGEYDYTTDQLVIWSEHYHGNAVIIKLTLLFRDLARDDNDDAV